MSVLRTGLKSGVAAASLSVFSGVGIWYFASSAGAVSSVAGEWMIVETWSENEYLARLNVHEGTSISVGTNGFLKAGRLGIDGIVGKGLCGVKCATFTVNGFDQKFSVVVGGKSDGKLILTNANPAAVIVAKRVK